MSFAQRSLYRGLLHVSINAVEATRPLVTIASVQLIDVVPVLAFVNALCIPICDVHWLQQFLVLAGAPRPSGETKICVVSDVINHLN